MWISQSELIQMQKPYFCGLFGNNFILFTIYLVIKSKTTLVLLKPGNFVIFWNVFSFDWCRPIYNFIWFGQPKYGQATTKLFFLGPTSCRNHSIFAQC